MAKEPEKEKPEKPKAERPEKVDKAEKPEAAGAEGAVSAAPKKKVKRLVDKAIVHINATFNNTIVTFTDTTGATLCWASAGTIGFTGSKKSTPFAAQRAAEQATEKAKRFGVREVEVRVKGPGAGRESAVTALMMCGLIVRGVEDVTPLPHNGCRPRKRRRV